MFAISFDLDIESLRQTYGDPYNNAYREIRMLLKEHGFKWQQGSVYFGDLTITAVDCVLVTYKLVEQLPWFASSVRDIRMLRIEDNNDLMPAVELASKKTK
jgi:virulence-associated protein VapD